MVSEVVENSAFTQKSQPSRLNEIGLLYRTKERLKSGLSSTGRCSVTIRLVRRISGTLMRLDLGLGALKGRLYMSLKKSKRSVILIY